MTKHAPLPTGRERGLSRRLVLKTLLALTIAVIMAGLFLVSRDVLHSSDATGYPERDRFENALRRIPIVGRPVAVAMQGPRASAGSSRGEI